MVGSIRATVPFGVLSPPVAPATVATQRDPSVPVASSAGAIVAGSVLVRVIFPATGSIRTSQAPTCWYWVTQIVPPRVTALVTWRKPVGPVRSILAVTTVGRLCAGSGVGIGVGSLDGRLDDGGVDGMAVANGLTERLVVGVAPRVDELGVG